MNPNVAIIGAGTMGAGIAQVAATAGWSVCLLDIDQAIVDKAFDGVRRRLERLVEKGRIDDQQRQAIDRRLGNVAIKDCPLVIEAVVEDIDIKTRVLKDVLAKTPIDTIIATNTSSLSVGALGEALGIPERVVGMHFFNPAPLMKLVEVIAGSGTDPDVVDRVCDIATGWGKKVARAADVPGFIVNHVARPYYLEAFRMLEDGVATAQQIDHTMRTLGGFRMGPLELTDLIGQDVNTATTRSVWEQLDHPPLLHPSELQERLVQDGHLGRKSGRGVYEHSGEKLAPALTIDATGEVDAELSRLVAPFAGEAGEEGAEPIERYIFARILVALIAQAGFALERGVATAEDIDTALKYGTNYPHGPFEWARLIGPDHCTELLTALNQTVEDNRFAVPGWLKKLPAS